MWFSFLEKFGAAVLIVVWLIFGTNRIGDMLVHVDEPAAPAVAAAKAAAPAQAAPAKDPGDLLALLAAADVLAGEKVFKKCKACHTADDSGKHKIGPNVWEVVGRTKANVPGYTYSGALKQLGGKWGYAELDAFLTKPKDFVPGTKMKFAGLKKAKQRAAVILYLRALSDSPLPLP